MEEKKDYPKEFTTKLLQSRTKIELVIKYLDKLEDKKPDKEVNDDCVRMLMEVLNVQIKMYLDLNNLPKYNTELELKNNILKGENNRMQKEIDVYERMLKRVGQ